MASPTRITPFWRTTLIGARTHFAGDGEPRSELGGPVEQGRASNTIVVAPSRRADERPSESPQRTPLIKSAGSWRMASTDQLSSRPTSTMIASSRAGVTQLAECLLPKSEPPSTPAPLVVTPAFRPQLSAVPRPRSQGAEAPADAARPGVAAVRLLAWVRRDGPTAVLRTSKPRLA